MRRSIWAASRTANWNHSALTAGRRSTTTRSRPFWTLRAVLKRLGVPFDLPFKDFKGFHGYWSSHGMSGPGGWGARRGYLSEVFNPVLPGWTSSMTSVAAVRACAGWTANLGI